MSGAGASWDVVVVGAGVFGAWTARQLRAAGKSVLLVDQYGPANARASASGESRAIRMSYGADDIYTRFSHAADDVVNARIYLGIHFRFADVVARKQGEQVAEHAVEHFLLPLERRGR